MMEVEISPERRERIDSVLDEILSVPRLIEANLTQRSLSNPRQMRKYLGGSERLSESGSRQGTMRSSHISGSRVSGKQVPGSQVSERQVSGRQVPGNQVSGSRVAGRQLPRSRSTERQNSQPSNKLLLSGREATARQGTTAAAHKGNTEQVKYSQQRGRTGQGARQPSQGGKQASRQGSSRQQVLRRAVSSPKLDLIPEQRGSKVKGREGGGDGVPGTVPPLQLNFSGSSASIVVPLHESRRMAEERSRVLTHFKTGAR